MNMVIRSPQTHPIKLLRGMTCLVPYVGLRQRKWADLRGTDLVMSGHVSGQSQNKNVLTDLGRLDGLYNEGATCPSEGKLSA